MSDDQFTKLFKYIEEFRQEVGKRFDENAKEHADIRGAIAELSAQVKSYHEEMLFLSHKVDRLERWIHEIAKQTGVKLSEA